MGDQVTAAAIVLFAFVALCAGCAVVDWLAQKDRELEMHIVDVLDPIVPSIPAPRPDWDANIAAFDSQGVTR